VIEVVWTILRQEDRFLLAQRSTSDVYGGTWVFPGGKIDLEDQTPTDAANRGLKEEVGLKGEQFNKLCSIHLDEYNVQVFCCNKWLGKPQPTCKDIIGVGWFTLAEMYTLGQSLAPFINEILLYLAYLIQHYDSHPDEWQNKRRKRDEND
jgi:8-oxo-dGTP pyrophosphatase MutT (NUDIX family)